MNSLCFWCSYTLCSSRIHMHECVHTHTHTHTQLCHAFILLIPASHPPSTPWELPTCLALLQLSASLHFSWLLLVSSSPHFTTLGCSVLTLTFHTLCSLSAVGKIMYPKHCDSALWFLYNLLQSRLPKAEALIKATHYYFFWTQQDKFDILYNYSVSLQVVKYWNQVIY